MALSSITISSAFTLTGNPSSGLLPTISIFEVGVPAPIVLDGVMTEIFGGMYSFEFTTALGYDPTVRYHVQTNGTTVLPKSERYQHSVIDPIEHTIPNEVWEASTSAHSTIGTMGGHVNSIEKMVDLLLKYEENRTKIDKNAMTLTVYDDDGTTPIKVFDLKDSQEQPSITEIFHRVPQ